MDDAAGWRKRLAGAKMMMERDASRIWNRSVDTLLAVTYDAGVAEIRQPGNTLKMRPLLIYTLFEPISFEMAWVTIKDEPTYRLIKWFDEFSEEECELARMPRWKTRWIHHRNGCILKTTYCTHFAVRRRWQKFLRLFRRWLRHRRFSTLHSSNYCWAESPEFVPEVLTMV